MCDEKAPSADREEIDCAQVAIDLLHAAERELGSFVSAVRELFGAEQVPQAIEDWMQELIAIDWPRQNAAPDWRCVSITAALRLSRRSEVRTVYKKGPHQESISGYSRPAPIYRGRAIRR